MELDLWPVSADRAVTDSGVCAHTHIFVLPVSVFLIDPAANASCRLAAVVEVFGVHIFMHPHLMTQSALCFTAGAL